MYETFSERGGGIASYKILLKTLATQFPEDHYYIVSLDSSELVSLGELGNVTVVKIKPGLHKELARFRLEAAGLRRIAKAHEVDVIWSTNVGPYLRTGIPQVMSVINAFQIYPWSVTRHHPDNRFHVAALRWFFRRSLARCDAALVETSLMGEYLSRVKGAPARIAVIPKAVESLDDFPPAPLPERIVQLFQSGLGKDTFTFLYVATPEPHKNHKILLPAVQRLGSLGLQARLALTVTADQLFRIGGRLARQLVENGYILPLGWVPKENLRAVYDACQACVMPSVLESLSSAHLEAMHWGRPQICADLPYAHDLCGEAAAYAAAENPSQWAAQMQRMLCDAPLRSALVKAGCERMKDYPATWKEVARRVRAFLAEVAGLAEVPGNKSPLPLGEG